MQPNHESPRSGARKDRTKFQNPLNTNQLPKLHDEVKLHDKSTNYQGMAQSNFEASTLDDECHFQQDKKWTKRKQEYNNLLLNISTPSANTTSRSKRSAVH